MAAISVRLEATEKKDQRSVTALHCTAHADNDDGVGDNDNDDDDGDNDDGYDDGDNDDDDGDNDDDDGDNDDDDGDGDDWRHQLTRYPDHFPNTLSVLLCPSVTKTMTKRTTPRTS